MEILNKERLLSTKLLNVDIAEIKTNTGKVLEHYIIEPLRNSVAAVAIKNGKIIMIKTKRLFWDKPCWEIPGGLIQEGEIALSAIRRKVEEETGFSVQSIIRLGSTFGDIGLNKKEKYYFFIELGEKIQDYNRDIVEMVSSFTFDQVHNLIDEGKIVDERTLTGLMLAEHRYRK